MKKISLLFLCAIFVTSLKPIDWFIDTLSAKVTCSFATSAFLLTAGSECVSAMYNSYKGLGPTALKNNKAVKNEFFLAPLWLTYYSLLTKIERKVDEKWHGKELKKKQQGDYDFLYSTTKWLMKMSIATAMTTGTLVLAKDCGKIIGNQLSKSLK